ncbi:hypothetical protein [Gehongia tenuis]|uniref:Uncharacterized protein n=1 Tax=Gehongia tenuis TaxID=2763655 RepID=A0A926D7G3_9FIRM|nr:hypothetical protein [Gehongia tenuis]MBC8531765.1 hypothetical protein [Gehongia tenuis]
MAEKDILMHVRREDSGAPANDYDILYPKTLERLVVDENGIILKDKMDTKLDKVLYTPEDILTKVKTVDGEGSGLDADTVDGMHAAGILAAARKDIISLTNSVDASVTGPAKWAELIVPVDSIIGQVGSKFTVSNGRVVIPSGVSAILVSCAVGQQPSQFVSDQCARIYVLRNGQTAVRRDSWANNDKVSEYTWYTAQIQPVLITGVQTGDLIELRVSCGGGGEGKTVTVSSAMAILTVQEV